MASGPLVISGLPKANLLQWIKFAFFVSPIHFEVVLGLPKPDEGKSGASARNSMLTIQMMFKGTGWQVTGLRLSDFDSTQRVASVPR
jgi:hypothetical protein